MSANTFNGPKAIAMLARIEAFIASRPTTTVLQIADEMRIATGTVCNYTRELWLSGAIRKTNPDAPHSVGTIWEKGEDPEAVEAANYSLQPVRRIVTTWEPNYARDRLHCFLFGMPARLASAQGEVHA